MIQGPSCGSSWTLHKITNDEIDQFQAYLSMMMELLEAMLDDSHRQWEGLVVVARSLERRVPTEWVSKEVRVRAKLEYDSEVFLIAEDHLILQFKLKRECSFVKTGGPWFVGGQLLVMEDWELDFVPGCRAIQKAVVWLRLLGLPLEY